MKKGKCPKCQGTEVYWSTSTSSMGAGVTAGENQLLLQTRRDEAWAGDFHFSQLSYYACKDCGYMEIYSEDRGALDRLHQAANWIKVKW